jgi:hypothetical protein
MSKLNLLFISCTLGGIVLVLFQSISSMMTTGDIVWKSKSLTSIFGEEAFTWIENISISVLQNFTEMIVTMQLYILLLALGGIFFILGMIFKN